MQIALEADGDESRGWSGDPSIVLAQKILLWLHKSNDWNDFSLPYLTRELDLSGLLLTGGFDAWLRTIESLEDRDLIETRQRTLIETQARISVEGRSLTSRWLRRKGNISYRRLAHRAAYLSWLGEGHMRDYRFLLDDPRSYFFGEQYTEHEHRDYIRNYRSLGLITESDPAKLTAEGHLELDRWRAKEDSKGLGATFFLGRVENVATGSQGFQQNTAQKGGVEDISIQKQLSVLASAFREIVPVLQLQVEKERRAMALIDELLSQASLPHLDQIHVAILVEEVQNLAVSGDVKVAGAGAVALAARVLETMRREEE